MKINLSSEYDSVSPSLVVCDGVKLSFPGPVQALDGITLDLKAGELVSIVGPSGCGKSTLLRLIAGLIQPTSGHISVAGHSPIDARKGDSRIGFVFQEATLLPWRSVADNIRLPLEFQNVERDEQEPRISASLELIGLSAFRNSLPAQLSGGMRMRVALARALVTHPRLLLLDEPFGALDEITRQRLNEDLLGLWEAQRWSAVFITHNVFEAVFLSQRVLVMSARPGRLVAELPIPLGFPRDPDIRGTAEFARICAEVSQHLRKAAE